MTTIIENNTNLRSSEIKLTEEKRRLALLQESLTRSNTLTNGMISTLENFERKLQLLDELVTPVYEATNELHLLSTNVDKSLSIVDSVLHYYDICAELTPIITSGPAGNLNDYLSELDRLEDAVKYFKRTTAVSERERVVQLFDLGRKRLVEETDKLILRYANPLSPKELIDLCELSTNNSNDIHAMQEADMGTLRRIIEWFSAYGFRQGLIDSYATKRSTMIRRSLQLLAEYLSKTAIRRISTITNSSPSNSPQIQSNTDSPKRTGKRITDFRRIIHSGRDSSSHNSNKPQIISSTVIEDNVTFDASDDRETNNYKVLLDAFLFLLKRDRDLLNYVFPNELQSLVFAKLIEYPLVYMHEEAQRLCKSIQQLPRKLDTGKFAIYGIFSILRWFLKSRTTFSMLSKESDVTRRQQFTTLSATFEKSAANCLRDILEQITTDNSPPSQGGNVHPLTSHVLAFMEGLLAYEDTATIIAIIYFESEQKTTGNSSGSERGLYELGYYFAQLVRELHSNLSKKVDGYVSRTDTTIRSVFLLNNVNYLLKRLDNSSVLAIIQRCQSDLRSKYEADFQMSLKDYTKCYSPLIIPIQQLLEYDNVNRLPDTKLRDRDREQIKESFSAVNTAIDTIRQQCEQYIVSDVELRNRLRNEGKSLILEIYQKYYSKFAHKDFTKHRERYIRYEPRALESIIDNFFEHRS